MKSDEKEKSKSKAARWAIGVGLVFMVGMFVASVTPFGLAVWLGIQDEAQEMVARIQEAPLHREAGALTRVFRLPVLAKEVYWREVSMRRPLQGADSEDKALWAVLHYDEAGFEALLAPLPEGEAANTEALLPWLLEDMERSMGLRLFPGVEVRKLPSALFAGEATEPKSVGAYVVPSQRCLVLMRFGVADSLVK
jgi:hypothetical protein